MIESPIGMIVDSSHSASYIIPVMNNSLVNNVTWVDVGGKLITKYLKDIISYKYLNLKNCFYLVEHIKKLIMSVDVSDK